MLCTCTPMEQPQAGTTPQCPRPDSYLAAAHQRCWDGGFFVVAGDAYLAQADCSHGSAEGALVVPIERR